MEIETNIGKYKITLTIFNKLKKIVNGITYVGSPLFPIDKNILELSSEQLLKLKGSFIAIQEKDDSIIIANDYFGGGRLYYIIVDNEYHFSDDYNYLIDLIDKDNITLSEDEYEYWKAQRYTTGGSTLFNEIKKVEPHSIITLSEKGINFNSYYNNIEHKEKSKELFKKSVSDDLKDTFNRIKETNKDIVLCFSGGSDSVLLATFLQKVNIDFKAVFFIMKPYEKESYKDYLRAKNVAKVLNIELSKIEIKEKDIDDELLESITNKLLFDRHFSVVHFISTKKISDLFGKNILIVNGQSSDNVFSFGPSCGFNKSFSEPLARLSLYYPNSILNKLGCKLYSKKLKLNLSIPKDNKQYYSSFINHIQYKLYHNKNYDYKYLEEYIKSKIENDIDIENNRMVLKLSSYLQGSDNQVVLQSAWTNNVDIIMPFASYGIVKACLEYKDNFKELMRGKYILFELLKEVSPEIRKKMYGKVDLSNIKFEENISSKIEVRVNNSFEYKIKKIMQ